MLRGEIWNWGLSPAEWWDPERESSRLQSRAWINFLKDVKKMKMSGRVSLVPVQVNTSQPDDVTFKDPVRFKI